MYVSIAYFSMCIFIIQMSVFLPLSQLVNYCLQIMPFYVSNYSNNVIKNGFNDLQLVQSPQRSEIFFFACEPQNPAPVGQCFWAQPGGSWAVSRCCLGQGRRLYCSTDCRRMWRGGALGLAAVLDAATAFSEALQLNTVYSYFFWDPESREEEEHAGHRSPALWNGAALLLLQYCAHLSESAASLTKEKV